MANNNSLAPKSARSEPSKPKISQILANNAIKALAQDLALTREQIIKANGTALTLSTNPKLKDCDPMSLVRYCYEIARYNFSRDDCAYPVPYKNAVQAQIGFKGFRELALRSNKYNQISCSLVTSADRVFRDRDTGEIRVEFNEDFNAANQAEIIGYYAFAKNKENIVVNSKYMSKEECEKHGRHYSKTYDSIWGDKEFGFDKMAMKTVIKQLCSELAQTPELSEAMNTDQIVFTEKGKGYYDNPNSKENTTVFAEELDFTAPTTPSETKKIEKKEKPVPEKTEAAKKETKIPEQNIEDFADLPFPLFDETF